MSPDTQMAFYGVVKDDPPSGVTEAMVDAADAAVPYLPAEIHRRRPAIRKMLEAAYQQAKENR